MRPWFVDTPTAFKIKSLVMSFMNEMKSQHDPIKKQTDEMKLETGGIVAKENPNIIIK